MPCPFPGMDPFLEHPDIFPDLHNSMIAYLREALNAELPDAYYASIASRTWIEMSQRHVEPDVNVIRPQPAANGGPKAGGGGIAVAEVVRAEPIVVRVPSEEFREPFLDIYSRRGGERLVTTLEVLSLANKTPGEKGRELYLRKQQEMLDSQVNLVEIDLLRGGVHTTAVPLAHAIAQTGAFDYHICIHGFDHREEFLVYPISMPGPLPDISIPLLPDDAAVRVSLQKALERSYEAGKYAIRAHYHDRNTRPPLRSDLAEWVERTLREKGVRKGTAES